MCIRDSINSIPGKDRQSKQLGPSPLAYLGITYSTSGLTATLHEMVNSQWQQYTDVDGGASYQISGVPEQYRGQGFNFGKWFPTYDWVTADGYTNFSNWVG